MLTLTFSLYKMWKTDSISKMTNHGDNGNGCLFCEFSICIPLHSQPCEHFHGSISPFPCLTLWPELSIGFQLSSASGSTSKRSEGTKREKSGNSSFVFPCLANIFSTSCFSPTSKLQPGGSFFTLLALSGLKELFSSLASRS